MVTDHLWFADHQLKATGSAVEECNKHDLTNRAPVFGISNRSLFIKILDNVSAFRRVNYSRTWQSFEYPCVVK